MTPAEITEFDAMAVAKEIKHCLTVIDRAETSLISSKRRAAWLLQDVAKNHPARLREVCDLAGIGASRRKELLQIALGHRTPEEIKCLTKERVKRHRENKKTKAPEAESGPLQQDVTATTIEAAASDHTTVPPSEPRAHPPPSRPPVSDAERSLAQFRVACDTWLPKIALSMHAAAEGYVREVLMKTKAAKATDEAA
jgi:hypothetical protein